MQLGTLVAAARASGPMDAALITLLGILGLRVSEAYSVDLEDFGLECGHRTLHIIGKSASRAAAAAAAGGAHPGPRAGRPESRAAVM